MTPDRWKRIQDLLQSSLERKPAERAAFLAIACADDEDLRKEVESLLDSSEQDGSFLKSPAFEEAAALLAGDNKNAMLGRRIGSYQIISPLGAGGMGEVYLAQDTRLGRRVALKILPSFFTKDEQRLRRFQQEARAASALNHPNIITIFDIGQVDDTHFIATEYIAGETLRSAMAKRNMRLSDALEVAIQTGNALGAAHEAGIVHRDIKPENIMLRPDGYVKVLDFGLAKLTERPITIGTQADTIARVDTDPGTVMGTASYMSPEQARGRDVDARTDIFSLGVVLYEMVAGRVPFEGESTSDVIGAILEKEPPPLARYDPEAPSQLQWIVSKALRKDRDERYQTGRDLLGDLKELKQELDHQARLDRSVSPEAREAGIKTSGLHSRTDAASGSSAQTADGTARTTSSAEYIVSEIKRHKTGAVLVLVALLVAVGALVVGRYKFAGPTPPTTKPVAPLQTMQLKKLTTGVVVSNVNISPDGKYVVYSVQLADAQEGLWIKQTATGTTLQIVPSAKAHFGGTSFSPDSNFVYYVLLTEDDPHRSLYLVPVIGGTSKKLLNSISGPVTFSPDGKRLAFVRRDARQGEDDLMTANADGSGIQTLATRKGLDWFKLGPSWSPDGKRIACGAGTNAGGLVESVYEVGVDTGAVKQITPQKWAGVGRVCWLGDGSGLLVLAAQQGQRLSQIWEVSYPSGEAHRITNDLHDHGESSLGVTADSSVLAALDSSTASNIWITAANGDTSRAKQITVRSEAGDGVYCLAWTSDGKLVYSSAASGTSDIWLMNADGTNQRQLTNDSYVNYGAAVSPDNRYVVFASNRADSTPHIWRMDIDGSNLRQLTNTEDRGPSFTLDGQWVIYQSYRTGKATLWKVPVDGGEPVQLTDYASLGPEVSPDGKLILCDYFDEQVTPTRWRMAVISSDGGPPIKLFDHVEHPIQKEFDWSGDGRALLFLGMPILPGNIWSQPLDGGKAVPLTNFSSDYIYNFARSRDGRQIAYSRGVDTSDVIMIMNFK